MKRIIILTLTSIIVLTIVSLFAFSSFLVRYGFDHYFRPQQLTLAENLIVEVNPFELDINVKNLAVLHQQQTQLLSFNHLNLNMALMPIFDDKLLIENIELQGLTSNLKVDNDALFLNNWPLSHLTNSDERKNKNNVEAAEAAAAAAAKSKPAFKLITIKNLVLADITVNSTIDGQQHNAVVKNIELTDINYRLANNKHQGKLQFKVNSDLTYEGKMLGNTLATQIKLSGKPEITLFQTGLSATLLEPPFKISLENTLAKTATSQLKASLEYYELALTKLDFATAGPSIEQNSESIKARLSADFGTRFDKLKLFDDKHKATLMSVKKLNLSKINTDIQIDTDAKIGYEFKVDDTNLEDLVAMQNDDNQLPTLLELSAVDINNISVNNSHINIDKITLGSAQTNAVINQSKSLANLYLPNLTDSEEAPEQVPSDPVLEESNNELDKSAQKQKESKKQIVVKNEPETVKSGIQIPSFRLGQWQIDAPLKFNTVDMSVEPNFRSLVRVSKFDVSEIDTRKPDLTTSLNFSATNNTYSTIDVTSSSLLANPTPKHQITVNLKEVDLESVSPYISGALGYHINTGQLDADVDANIIGEKIKGEADLQLRALDLTELSSQGEESGFSSGVISFNYALSMLKDGDGNVDLNVPFDGDLNDPSVGFSGFLTLIVERATMSAAKDYLINTFVPYANVVNFALSAGKHVLKMRFKDLTLDSNNKSLDDSHLARLDELAAVLKKHDSTTIKLCAISTTADLTLNDKDVDVSSISAKSINAEQVQFLLNLAQQRAESAKAYLVQEKQIASKRILSCVPKINYGKSAVPIISFNQT